MNKIARSIFKILKFSPPVSNAFHLTYTKLPLDENLLLVFKRVLDTNFESGHTNLKYIKNKVPIENLFKNFFEIGGGGGAVLLLWAIFLPLWH
jgi:hypothetical protein